MLKNKVNQCYKCGRYGHIGKYCTKKEICRNCGEDSHTNKEQNEKCDKEERCNNCIAYNSTVKVQSKKKNTKHTCFAKSCPVRESEIAKFKNKINYGHN